MRVVRLATLTMLVTTQVAAGGNVFHAEPPPQNVVLILTDDQRWDAVRYMPQVESLLVDHGVSFANAFENNPLCCPTRTTIMTGLTSGHNGVWANGGPYGGYKAFKANHDQTRQVFGWLHGAGYRTALVGKFLNGYPLPDHSWVMGGVDDWQAFLLAATDRRHTGCKSGGYFSTCYSNNGALELHGLDDYSTTTSGQKAVDFIESAPLGQPLFLYYAPRAPHGPTTPQGKYKHSCLDIPPIRPPSYNQAIVNGPQYMAQIRSMGAGRRARLDRDWIRSCQTLLSVDEQVAAIVQALSDTGRLHDTLIVFASDNGMLFGEHRWEDKTVPYEESIRIPVVVRDDTVIPRAMQGTTVTDQITSLDYTPTFLQAAGMSRDLDGQSLFPLFGGDGTWVPQDDILIEHSEDPPGHHPKVIPPAYCGVREPGYMYARYRTGEEELYDLMADPYELRNVAGKVRYQAVLAATRESARRLCDPPPPGYVWSP
jgi:arylsulfatase A-like enzyme